jgi:hypothetical protein
MTSPRLTDLLRRDSTRAILLWAILLLLLGVATLLSLNAPPVYPCYGPYPGGRDASGNIVYYSECYEDIYAQGTPISTRWLP